MNLRHWLYIVIPLLLLLWLFWPRTATLTNTSEATNQSASSANATTEQSKLPTPTNVTAVPSTGSPLSMAQNNPSTGLDLYRQALEAQNSPLDFYGKVIDQDSNSLSEVKINLRVRHWDAASFGASIPITKETDAEGRFDIHGVTGDGFSIESMEREGYELEPRQRNFGVATGSVESPIIFIMWSSIYPRISNSTC